MATLVLGAVGSAVGGTLAGPAFAGIGAVFGRAAGSYIGNQIDHHVFGQSTRSEGPRLQNLDVQTSTEGAPLPLTFGRTRLSGQIIWATNYEEVATTTKHKTGGKGGGGPSHSSTTYSYFANLAIGLCEGPVASINRVWADGKLLDLNTVTMRLHTGGQDQTVDPLIEAREGSAPAFKDTAYVVFERLPLEPYGNRLPQLSFEVIRPVDTLEEQIRAVTIIPGATEFGYDPNPVIRTTGPGVSEPENTHDPSAPSDWHASIDQLQALCPNLERVALVVAWFGTSLDAATCTIEPRVESTDKVTSTAWSAAGLSRATATPVSLHDGRAAFGSSPSDASLVAAIQDLKARGLKVTLLPFIMMDIPADNTLADPWTGAASQPAYPWRGEITVSPAPGQAGSIDHSTAATDAIAQFVGSQSPSAQEWSFRRFILHLADLAIAAGGVDAFILGSELRGLTRVRDETGGYPFVDALVALAADIRLKLGPDTILTYAADWSEYANHQPADGSGDLIFHLDPLWASPDIDVIGIDQYQPLTDWRHAPSHLDQSLGEGPHDPAVILAGLTGGENYDWYYASQADRAAQNRTPITDGAYGEPWVYRSKDLVSWWSNAHHNRVGGVRQAASTAFVPASKPIWLTEFGAPAVDLAGNQPSAFPSDKPENDSLPFGSQGRRDDAQQRALLDTALGLWAQEGSDHNPLSPVDDRPMIDPSGIHLWTWDARPYPLFPQAQDLWSDGQNWYRGHWLNGRLGTGSLAAILHAIGQHHELPLIETSGVNGMVEGYTIREPSSGRALFDDLSAIYAFDVVPDHERCKIQMRGQTPVATVDVETVAERPDTPLISATKADRETLARQITLGFASAQHDHQTGIVRSQVSQIGQGADRYLRLGATLDPAVAAPIAQRLLEEEASGAIRYQFSLPPSLRALEPGDVLHLNLGDTKPTVCVRIERVVDGTTRLVEARAFDQHLYEPAPDTDTNAPYTLRPVFGPPDALILDLPAGDEATSADHNVKIAGFAQPWPGSLTVYAGSEATGFEFVQSIAVPATLGSLVEPLAPGPVAYPHRGGSLTVTAPSGSLSSVSQDAVMAGANLAALVSTDGLEIIQFQSASLQPDGAYRLSGLVRGLGGTEQQAALETPSGTRFVLLDAAITDLQISLPTVVGGTTLRIEPAGGGVGPFSRLDLTALATPRSLQPLAPVHLRAVAQDNGDLAVTWVRRTRGRDDLWELSSVPLNEESQLYRVSVAQGSTLVRTTDVTTPSWTYTASDQSADGLTAPFLVTVQQIGSGGRLGQTRQMLVQV